MPYFPPQPERKPPEKSPRGRRWLKGIALGVSLLLIGYGGVNLGMYIQDYVSVRRTAQELRDAAKAGSDGSSGLFAEDRGWQKNRPLCFCLCFLRG